MAIGKSLRAYLGAGLIAAIGILASPGRASAEPPAPAATPAVPEIVAADTAFMMAAAGLVMLMTPGLGLFYGGMVRSKSVLNMMMMTFGALAAITVIWVLVGYSLAFGDDVGGTELDAEVGAGLVAPHQDDAFGAQLLGGEHGHEAHCAVADDGNVLPVFLALVVGGHGHAQRRANAGAAVAHAEGIVGAF